MDAVMNDYTFVILLGREYAKHSRAVKIDPGCYPVLVMHDE